jgi:hypothetical protein
VDDDPEVGADGLLLIAGQPGKAVGESVGDAEFSHAECELRTQSNKRTLRLTSIELESRKIPKRGRHSPRLVNPQVLLFVIGTSRQVTPVDNIGMLRVGLSVGIKSQTYFEHYFSETNTTTDSGLWCISKSVMCIFPRLGPRSNPVSDILKFRASEYPHFAVASGASNEASGSF